MPFDYTLDFRHIDFRRQPELYVIGRGEQGVLLVEPYKSELLPHWRFKTPQIARKSAKRIYVMFLQYKRRNDFVGMDMARKFLQMGYTRSRRYANHRSGRKYSPGGRQVLPPEKDAAKAECARAFYQGWKKAREDEHYLAMKAQHRKKHEAITRQSGRARRR